ncbi:MAG: DUF4625 domain-containing protein [Carboxylicivirga sp.]|jgi:hypothetical protein|nr:DUF4625 domain-containing protein [Carboxylicivirga sp.]
MNIPKIKMPLRIRLAVCIAIIVLNGCENDKTKETPSYNEVNLIETIGTYDPSDNSYTVDFMLQVQEIADLSPGLTLSMLDIWKENEINRDNIEIRESFLYVNNKLSTTVEDDGYLHVKWDDFAIEDREIKLGSIKELSPGKKSDNTLSLTTAAEKYSCDKNALIDYKSNNEINYKWLNKNVSANLYISFKYSFEDDTEKSLIIDFREAATLTDGLPLHIKGKDIPSIEDLTFNIEPNDSDDDSWTLESETITNVANQAFYDIFTDIPNTLQDFDLTDGLATHITAKVKYFGCTPIFINLGSHNFAYEDKQAPSVTISAPNSTDMYKRGNNLKLHATFEDNIGLHDCQISIKYIGTLSGSAELKGIGTPWSPVEDNQVHSISFLGSKTKSVNESQLFDEPIEAACLSGIYRLTFKLSDISGNKKTETMDIKIGN